MNDNPLLERWGGPFGGTPAFDRVRTEHFKPALEAAMDAYRRDVTAITDSPDSATFENTIERFEDAGRTFSEVGTLFGIWSSSMSSPAFQVVEREMAPVLSAFSDELTQNAALFARIEAVYAASADSALTDEQKRLVWLHHTSFVRAGARLDATGKERVGALNQRLATLYTSFSQNLLGDEEAYVVTLETEADLGGLPDAVRAGAAATAQANGMEGKWAFTNTRSSVEPFLMFSSRRDLRERIWRNFVRRGDNHDARDNGKIVSEILALRAERARLLGFPTHAHWRLEDSMAKTPGARAFADGGGLEARRRASPRGGQRHAGDRRRSTRAPTKIAPWDYRYYAEKVRKARYDLDQNEIKPYLQLDRLRTASSTWQASCSASSSRGRRSAGLPPGRRRLRGEGPRVGRHVGLWYFDPYARPGKHSGAWMNAYRNQERFEGRGHDHRLEQCELREGRSPASRSHQLGRRAAPSSTSSATRCTGWRATCATPASSGTNVARDYVEFPSQLLEHWLDDAGGALALRAPLRDGDAHPRRARREDPEGGAVQLRASTPSSTWPARSWT